MFSSIFILFSVGFVAAVILAVASKVFHVEEDPRIEAVVDVLPGANCGGCGYPGCEGYAIAVVTDPAIEANLCVAGSDETTINVGKLTGKTVSEADPLICVRRCEKNEGGVNLRSDYKGMPSCAAAASVGSGLGFDACAYSCLGLGDCIKVCPFDALVIEDNLVKVKASACIACGKCTSACPRGLLELIPRRARVMVFCSTKSKGKDVTDACKVGCISCTLCVKKCPAKAVSMKNGIIAIDQQACLAYGPDCNEACVAACKRKIFKSLWTEGKIMPKPIEEKKPAKPAEKPQVTTSTEASTEAAGAVVAETSTEEK